ncbi:MAG: hypothetical protein HC877_08160 [Thioploca sp.]|nr:hypothetical protein [Thioploca sp.]
MNTRPLVSFDWAIKYLLRDKANFDILEGFLTALLRQNLTILSLLESESNQVTLTDTVTALGKIQVAPEDSGKKADIVMYAIYFPLSATVTNLPQYLMLDAQGQVLLWDGKAENLVPFQSNLVLEPVQIVYAYQGQLTVPAKVEVYLGYRLEDGTIVSSQIMNLIAK